MGRIFSIPYFGLFIKGFGNLLKEDKGIYITKYKRKNEKNILTYNAKDGKIR